MIKLTERLPDTVTVRGRKYRLLPDFRNVLRMMETLNSDDLIPEARNYQALRHVIKKPPKDDGICAELLSEVQKTLFPETKKAANEKRLTSFEQDADLIRGAFRQVYGIDLFRAKLHWMEFSCLLSCLPEGSRYTEVIGIRARPMPKPTRYNAEERRALAQAKASVAIQVTEKERERNLRASMQRTTASLLALAKRGGIHGG